MKKILLLALIVVSLGKLYGQDVVLGKFYAGGKLGYGTVNFKSTDPSASDFAESTFRNLSYGIVAGYKINSKISVQAEGLYAKYAANNIKYEYLYSPSNPLVAPDGKSTVDHVDMELQYIDIPVIAKYYFGKGAIAPYAYVGVNWGINLKGYTTITRATVDPVAGTLYTSYNDDITDLINYNDFAPIFGGGINISLGDKITIFGDLRYKYGVMNMSNVSNGLGFNNNSLWLSAGAAWNFDF
jgi:hypothetical protein